MIAADWGGNLQKVNAEQSCLLALTSFSWEKSFWTFSRPILWLDVVLSALLTQTGQNLLYKNLILHRYRLLGIVVTPEAPFLVGMGHNGAVVSNSLVKYEYLTSRRHGLLLWTRFFGALAAPGSSHTGSSGETATGQIGSGSLASSVSASPVGWEQSGDTGRDEDMANLLKRGLAVKRSGAAHTDRLLPGPAPLLAQRKKVHLYLSTHN